MKLNSLKRMQYNVLLKIGIVSFMNLFGSCFSNKDEEIIRNHPITTSNIFPDYYQNLFKPEVRKKLKLIITYEKIQKDTVSNLLFDDKYYIQIYTLSRIYDNSIDKSFHEYHQDSEPDVGVNFYDNERSSINILDKMVITRTDYPSDIYFFLSGNIIDLPVKTDKLFDCSMNVKNLSIKYSIKGPEELFESPLKIIY